MARNNSSLPTGFTTEAEKIAESIRIQMGLSIFSPLDAFALAKFLDVPVCPVDQLLEVEDVKKLKTDNSGKFVFSALCMENCDGDKIILHNPYHTACRQQSDLMHELAHIIRKHETSDEAKRICALLNLRPLNPVHEAEAVYLGGCLQITRAALLWKLKQKWTCEQISEHYGACLEMVQYRMKITGVERQRAYIYKRTSGNRA